MELGTIITGIIFLALAFSPLLLMSQSRKKAKKALLQSLAQVAAQHEGSVSKQEFFGDFAIGIDESNNAVFYVKKERDSLKEANVKLSDIQECRVINMGKTIKSKEDQSSYHIIERLDLSFVSRDKNKPEIRLNFYHSDSNKQLNEELKAVENWSKLVKEQMAKMPSSPSKSKAIA
jgi:hypothetical protein